MMAVHANEYGQELCQILGLDAGLVSSVSVEFNADEIVVAVVRMHPDGEQVEEIIKLIGKTT